MKEKTTPETLVLGLVSILLCFFTLLHGYGILFGSNSILLNYLNIGFKEPIESFPNFYKVLTKCFGLVATLASFLYLVSLIKKEFITKTTDFFFLKWAVFTTIISMIWYGGLVRNISNHQGAALLFFFSGLLYFLLWYLEHKSSKTTYPIFSDISLLPLYILLGYTMGLPGWNKIFGGPEIIERYNGMFKDTFLADLPGGISLMILFLGILELSIPVLLIISLIKGEFRRSTGKQFLCWSLGLAVLTFTMLCFGLSLLFNFIGSVNLVFYALFTFFMLLYISSIDRKPAA